MVLKHLSPSALTYILFSLNTTIDMDKHRNISFEDIEEHLNKGNIIDFLEEIIGDYLDFSLWDSAKRGEYSHLIKEIYDVFDRKEIASKFGIENNGICLLIGLTIELIQREIIK